jgi:uncharacterized OB-fold protein
MVFKINWWFDWDVREVGKPVFVPIWVIVAAAQAAAIAAWRLDTLARRRARLNHCPTCNYDRTGLPAASLCPECGAPTTCTDVPASHVST